MSFVLNTRVFFIGRMFVEWLLMVIGCRMVGNHFFVFVISCFLRCSCPYLYAKPAREVPVTGMLNHNSEKGKRRPSFVPFPAQTVTFCCFNYYLYLKYRVLQNRWCQDSIYARYAPL